MYTSGSVSSTEQRWLTREQARAVAEVRTGWLNRALNCRPCDRDRAEAAIREAYRTARLGEPTVIWFESPQALCHGLALLNCYDRLERPEPELARAPGASQVADFFHFGGLRPLSGRDSVAAWLWEHPDRLIGDWPMARQVRRQVDELLQSLDDERADYLPRFSVLTQGGAELWQEATANFGMPIPPTLSGLSQCEEAIVWQSYLAASEVAHPVIEASLRMLAEIGWVLPLDEVVLAVERPEWISDMDTWLASTGWPTAADESDPTWPGHLRPPGFSRWMVADALACADPIHRDAYLIAHGWGTGALRMLGSADDPANPGQRVELMELVGAGRSQSRRYVRVCNASLEMDGSRRVFVLEVSPDLADPIAAVAATFGLDAESYRQLARAC